VLIKRRKNITQLRYLAFLKRLMTLSLQLLHNGSLGCMAIVKNALQLNAALDILLDTENKIGSGKFDPTINDPEFCGSNCTSLFELTLLRRHYHSTVSKMANYILGGCQLSNTLDFNKLQPIELYEKFNSNEMAFHPPIAPPTSSTKENKSSKSFSSDGIKLKDLSEICAQQKTMKCGDNNFNFFNEF
jgi:nucleolar complex protein 3